MNNTITAKALASTLLENGSHMQPINPQEYHKLKPQLEEILGYPVISKSNLFEFMQCPYRYNFNRTHGIRKVSAEMSLGSLVDCLTLTPELFSSYYKCEPIRVQLKKDGTPYADGRQDPAQKAEWQAMAEQGITIISEEQLERAKVIAEAASSHLASHSLTPASYSTQVACWQLVKELDGHTLTTPVVICGMLDIAPHTGRTIYDLKTTSTDLANTTKLTYHLEDFGYPLQGAMYVDLYSACADRQMTDFALLFAGTTEPCLTRRVVLTADTLEPYRTEYKNAIRAYATAYALQDYGTPQLDTLYYSPTAKEARRTADFS